MTETLYRTTPNTTTWLGVPGTAFTVAHSKNAATKNGLRVSLTEWHADANDANGNRKAGSVSATYLRGDGRRSDVEIFATATFDSLEQAEAWAAECLS